MSQTITNQSYTGVAKTLHWVIMILLALMLFGGWTAGDLPREERVAAMQGHAGIGIIVLTLMIVRLFWRMTHPVPPLPDDLPRWQRIAATTTHHSLYLAVILQPLAGLAMTMTSPKGSLRPFDLFGLQVAPNETIHSIGHTLHGILPIVIVALIALHVAAALYHHFVRRDNVLKRMLPFAKV